MTPEAPLQAAIIEGARLKAQLLICFREDLRDRLYAEFGDDWRRHEPWRSSFWSIKPETPEEVALVENPASASEAVRARYIRKHGRWPFGDPKP